MNRLKYSLLLGLCLAACPGCLPTAPGIEDGGTGGADASTPPLDGLVKSFAHVSDAGQILGVGVVVPVASFENVPSDDNPRTGRLTALSVIAALKKLASPLAIGT